MLDRDVMERLVRRSIELAADARAAGNHPFGSLLADADGNVLLEAGNTVVTEHDVTGHAELNLVRRASATFDKLVLASTTLVTSTEPCPMCSGAIFWSGIGAVVYALGDDVFYDLVREESSHPEVLLVRSHEILSRGNHPIHVVGPVLEAEALEVHRGFWRTLGTPAPAATHDHR